MTKKRSFRVQVPEDAKKVVIGASVDASNAAWMDEERGLTSRSAFMNHLLEVARAERGSGIPEILRGARIEHQIAINREEGKLFLNSSGVYPGSGPPFGVPHDAVGGADEFIERGPHDFDAKCEGCRLLASSGMLPGVMREG